MPILCAFCILRRARRAPCSYRYIYTASAPLFGAEAVYFFQKRIHCYGKRQKTGDAMKKAILLAGGRGTRLAPLTDKTPKPLMPFSDKTVIEHLLFRLAAHGIRKVMISVGYLAESIQKALGYSYAGMSLCYLNETEPLGTAGGLVYAEKLLSLSTDEDFLVLSGDCVCDFDFSLGEAFHRKAGAEATIFTAESDSPCEYGIVLSDAGGRVYGFNEKPAWSQVNGNRINTGIYILNARILSRIPPRKYDFSNDLFPETVKAGTLFEYPAAGYWCDIGSPESYFACQTDALNGKIASVSPRGLSADELLKRGVTVHAPFYVSPEAHTAVGSVIGPNAVIGADCFLGEGSFVRDSILHPSCRVEAGCTVKKSILCRNSTVRKGAVLSDSILADSAVFSEEKASSTEHGGAFSFLSEEGLARDADGAYLLGEENALPQDAVADFGKALARAVGKNEKVGLLRDGKDAVSFYADFLSQGLRCAGARFFDFGTGFFALARFLAVKLHFDCFVFLRAEKGEVRAYLFNRDGLCPSHDFERRFAAARKSAVSEDAYRRGGKIDFDGACLYKSALIENFCAYLDAPSSKAEASSFAFALSDAFSPATPEETLFCETFLALSGKILSSEQAFAHGKPILSRGGDGGFLLLQDGVSFDTLSMTAAVLQKERRMGQTKFCLSRRAPEHLAMLLHDSKLYRYPEESTARHRLPRELSESQYFLRDRLFLCARMLSLLCGEGTTLSELSRTLPAFGFHRESVSVEDEKGKMRVIAALSRHNPKEKTHEHELPDEYEGIRIEYPLGTATVIPKRTAEFRILSESESFEAARELCTEVREEISKIASRKDQ